MPIIDKFPIGSRANRILNQFFHSFHLGQGVLRHEHVLSDSFVYIDVMGRSVWLASISQTTNQSRDQWVSVSYNSTECILSLSFGRPCPERCAILYPKSHWLCSTSNNLKCLLPFLSSIESASPSMDESSR